MYALKKAFPNTNFKNITLIQDEDKTYKQLEKFLVKLFDKTHYVNQPKFHPRAWEVAAAPLKFFFE